MKPSQCLTLAAILLLSSGISQAEPVTLDAEPVRVSMFKNGLAMVTSQTEVPSAGEYQIAAPQARYGSLWLSWEPGVSLTGILAAQRTQSEDQIAETPWEVLVANPETLASIKLENSDEWIEGTLVASAIPEGSDGRRNIFRDDDNHDKAALFKTAKGTLVIAPYLIEAVRFGEGDIKTVVARQIKRHMLTFNASEGEGEGNHLKSSYLAWGLAWSPSYAIHLTGDNSAHLSCKAVIVNDLMDLENVDVELVAGFPNLQHAAAPTAMGPWTLRRLLESLQSDDFDLSNALSNQSSGGYGGRSSGGMFGDSDDEDYPNVDNPITGENTEDLYFYQVGEMTLAKGERGYYPLVSANVPARDIYTWDVDGLGDDSDHYSQGPEGESQSVWHSLELTNTTDQPWTTAAGMTIKDGRVLGQDVLHYTPPGGTSLLRITQAVSINAGRNEYEVDRERDATSFYGRAYDKVTVEGTLSITNYKAEAVTIKVNKLVTGEVVSAEGGPEVVKLAGGLQRVNPRSKLTWETEVPPGREQAVKIVYRYSFYTR